MVGCESKNGHQKDIFENRLDYVFKLTILDPIVNIIGGLYDHSTNQRIFTLTMNRIFIPAPKIMRKAAMGTIWIY